LYWSFPSCPFKRLAAFRGRSPARRVRKFYGSSSSVISPFLSPSSSSPAPPPLCPWCLVGTPLTFCPPKPQSRSRFLPSFFWLPPVFLPLRCATFRFLSGKIANKQLTFSPPVCQRGTPATFWFTRPPLSPIFSFPLPGPCGPT